MRGQETKQNAVAGHDEAAWRDHLLAAIRAGSMRLLLANSDLDPIGTSSKGGLMGTDAALHAREGWGMARGRAI